MCYLRTTLTTADAIYVMVAVDAIHMVEQKSTNNKATDKFQTVRREGMSLRIVRREGYLIGRDGEVPPKYRGR